MATQTCPKCNKSFRVMEDEANDLFDCPYCGYDGLLNWTVKITLRARSADDAEKKFWENVTVKGEKVFQQIEIEREDNGASLNSRRVLVSRMPSRRA